MSAAPLVSVVIPCFNHAHYLRDSLGSVHAQDWPAIELAADAAADLVLERHADSIIADWQQAQYAHWQAQHHGQH